MEHIRSYEQDRLINMHKIQMIYEAEQLRSFKAVIEWIAGPQVVHVHESHQETRKECPGSGEWILKHRVIQDWIYSEPPLSSIVWMNGIPGAGNKFHFLFTGEGGSPVFSIICPLLWRVVWPACHRENYISLPDHWWLPFPPWLYNDLLLLQFSWWSKEHWYFNLQGTSQSNDHSESWPDPLFYGEDVQKRSNSHFGGTDQEPTRTIVPSDAKTLCHHWWLGRM